MGADNAESTIRLFRRDTTGHLVFDVSRLFFSFCLLIFSLISCIYAIQAEVTLVPSSAASEYFIIYISLIICLFLLGLYEGLQIAVVELAHQHPESYKNLFPRASYLISYENEDRNVERFLIGRQVIVVALVFILARITTFNGFFIDLPDTLITAVMHTGFLGVVLVVIVAQLTPQVLAAAYPVEFLNLPGMKYAFYVVLMIETSGLAYAVWGLSWFVKFGCGKCLCPHSFKNNNINSSEASRKAHNRSEKELNKKTNFKDLKDLNPTLIDSNNAENAENQVVDLTIHIENSPSAGGGGAVADATQDTQDSQDTQDTEEDQDTQDIEDSQNDQDSQDNEDNDHEAADHGEYSGLMNELLDIGKKLEFENNNYKSNELSNAKELDSNASLFYSFPLIIGNNKYPSPSQCFEKFEKNGLKAPKFLIITN